MNDLGAKTIVDSLGLTPAESFYVRMVAKSETQNGAGWKPPGVGSNNMGAITAGPNWTGQTFQYQDSRADGTTYTAAFRWYATPEDGFKDLARQLLKSNVRQALAAHNFWRAVSAQIDENGYTGDPPATPTPIYGTRLQRAGFDIQRATGEPLPFPLAQPWKAGLRLSSVGLFQGSHSLLSSRSSSVGLNTLAVRSFGPDVAFLQYLLRFLNLQEPPLAVDGEFGPKTREQVEYFQSREGLVPDGRIGPKTWRILHGKSKA